jgi:hypothetical protein
MGSGHHTEHRWPSYFLMVEKELRLRPTLGFIVLGDGTRRRIGNSEDLRVWVLEFASQTREARAAVARPIPVDTRPGQCRSCGQRRNCG